MAEIKKEENVVVKCDNNWILEVVSPWDYSNSKRWNNYIAVVTRNEKGDFNYKWLNRSSESDEYFCINEVKEGDILMAGVKDGYHPNRPSKKVYYRVIEKTNEKLVLKMGTTFRMVSSIEGTN